jgi:hypothetical protein
MKYIVSCILVLTLAGCGGKSLGPIKGPGFLKGLRKAPAAEAAAQAQAPAGEPIDLLAGVPTVPVGEGAETATGAETVVRPAAGAVAVEALDTTTPEQRREAVASAPTSGDGRIGSTVASLGAPGEPGFWIKTPLVSEEQTGRLVYVGSGRSVQVKLMPSGGPAGGGSQVSLAAMRLLDAPLAGLAELVVYSN